MRVFAIKADAERNQDTTTEVVAVQEFQDDFDMETEQNQQLEDCARQLNRIFNLCLSDR